MKFSIKNFFKKLWIWSHLLKKYLMENFIFCAVLSMNTNENASTPFMPGLFSMPGLFLYPPKTLLRRHGT